MSSHQVTAACLHGTCPQCRRRVRRLMALSLWGGFYHCPTTGRILEQLPGDDKVLCSCGRSNPRVWQERTEQTGVHLVRFLDAETVDEYLDQHDGRLEVE